MSLSEQEVQQRAPVWVALSDLFLDTQMQELTHKYIARTVCESSYTLEEAELILKKEVLPTCAYNLFTLIGEWEFFPEDWLIRKITRSPLWWMKFKAWYYRKAYSMIKSDWDKAVYYYKNNDFEPLQ